MVTSKAGRSSCPLNPELRGTLLSAHQVSLGEGPLGDDCIELDGLDHHLGFRVFPQLVLHCHPCRVVSVLERLDVSHSHDFQQFAALRRELDLVPYELLHVHPDLPEEVGSVFIPGFKL